MLKLIVNTRELDLQLLSEVYAGRISGHDDLQELYGSAYEFLRQKDAFYAVWAENGRWLSALRAEEYLDGILISGLETAPSHRNHGYAKALLQSVTCYLGNKKLYSHVARSNKASLSVHAACGFLKITDGAVFLDGSASASYVTLLKNNSACT